MTALAVAGAARPLVIEGATVLVTGATGGRGREIARRLDQRGARLVLSGRRPDALDAVAAGYDGARAIVCDLGRADERARLVAEAAEVDILVLVAGAPTGRLTSSGVDLLAPVLLARAAAPAMAERGRGRIVFVATTGGPQSAPRTRRDPSTGFALRGLAATLRHDLAGTGVGVTTVLTGARMDGDVAGGVIRAIEGNRAEVHVASIPGRLTGPPARGGPRASAFPRRI